MSNYKTFLAVLATLILVGLTVGAFQTQLTERNLEVAPDRLVSSRFSEQATTERVWQDRAPERVFTVGGIDSDLLYGPLRLKIDDRGHLFVFDIGDFRVKELDAAGRLLRVYGRGKGQGPGELASASDFEATPNGELWVSDSLNGRLSVFRLDGSFSRHVPLHRQPYRLSVGNGGEDGLFLMMPPGGDHLFARLDADGTLESFGRYLEHQAHYSPALDGWIEPAGDGGFVYSGMYAGILAGFDATGSARFERRTIEPRPLPKLVDDGRARWVDRGADFSALSMSVTDDEIHLLTYVRAGVKRKGVLDTYALSDGRYLYSRRVPEACTWAVVADGHLYTVDGVRVTKWRLMDAQDAHRVAAVAP